MNFNFLIYWRRVSQRMNGDLLPILLFAGLSIVPFLHDISSISLQADIQTLFSHGHSLVENTWTRAILGNNNSLQLWRITSVDSIFSIFLLAGLGVGFLTHFLSAALLFLGFFSSYRLLKHIFRQEAGISAVVFIFPSIFYVYNLYTLTLISGDYVALIPHLFIPLLLLVFLKGIETNKWTYIIYFALLSLFTFGINLVYDFILFFLIFLLYILFFRNTSFSRIKHLRYLLLLISITILINIWWALPFFYTSITNIGNTNNILQSETFYNNDSGALNVLRNLGFWAFFASNDGIPYSNFAQLYDTYLLYVSFFTSLIIFAFPLFIKKVKFTQRVHKENILLLYCAFLFLLVIIGGTYVSWPTASIVKVFFSKIPFAEIFRNTYKWTSAVIFIWSLLFAYICILIYQRNKKWAYYFFGISVLLVLVNMTPLLSGGFINTKYIVSGIPQYWYEMANYTNKSLDPLSNRILLLPDQYYFSAYNWEDSFKVIVVNIDDGLIQIPVVRDTCHGCGISYTLQVNSYLFNNLSTGKLEGLMQLFGLTHILQRNDFYLGYYKQTQSPSEIKQILSSYPDILLEKTIGQLDLYSYKQASSSPIIYSPDNVFAIDTLDDLVPSLQMHRLTRKDSFITLDDVKNQYLRNSVYMNYFFGVEPANVSKIEQINNSLYRIHVQTRSSFYLIFQESFHPKWELLVAPDEKRTFLTDLGFGKYEFVNSAAHYVANGYANGWFVDTDELCRAKHLCVQNPDGSYDIDMVIEFWPQRWFYLGLFISGTTLTGCIGYLLFDVWRGRRRSIDSLRSLR